VGNVKSRSDPASAFSGSDRYFVAFFPWRAVASCEGCLASARRSVFFLRLARFLALSLPLLCPIRLNFRPLIAPEQRSD